MRNLFAALFAFGFAATSLARPPEGSRNLPDRRATQAAIQLLQKLKAHPPKVNLRGVHALNTPLLAFLPSPSTILQGQSLTVLIEAADNFTSGTIMSVDFALNGGATASAPLIDNNGMFAANLGNQTIAGNNVLSASLYVESAANNTDLRSAIKNLNTSVNQLTAQINAQRDPVLRASLEEQRSEDIALENELVTELRTYRTLVGSQNFTYTVGPNTSSPTAPSVSIVNPSTGDVRGGTKVTFTGANFSPAFTVSFGGVTAPSVTYLSSTSVTAYTPDFGNATGIKDVELRFNNGGVISNVLLPGAYFATNVVPVQPQKPVAIASGSQNIRLGDTATLDASQSYDNRPTTFTYAWTVVSAPANSNYTAGQNIGAASTLTVNPSALGAYVFSLVVTEHDTAEHLVSSPSIAQVVVGNSPSPIAPSITLQRGQSATSQVLANDPSIGTAEIYAITTAPVHGTASISNSGLVTYVADANYVGADPLTVTVTNQSGLSGTVTIPVTVVEFSHAPAPTAPSITTHTEPGKSQISPNDPDPGMTFTYSVVVPPQHGTASVSGSGLVSYASSAGYVGTDLVIVEVTNSETPSQSGLANVAVQVNANSTPQVSAPNIFTQGGTAATSQATVTDDAGQTGTWSVSQPANGTASVSSSGLVTYTPNASFGGTDSITVSYTDNGNPGLTGTATISANVVGPPSASAPGLTAADGGYGTSQITVTSSTSGRTYNFAVTTPAANGTASVNSSGLATYVPTAPFTGNDSFVVKVTDTAAPTLFTTVTINATVTANHAPTASAPAITLNADTSTTSQITASDQDLGQTLSYAITTAPAHGTASVDANGLVTFTSTGPAVQNSDSIGVTVSDNGTPSLSATVTIPVTINGAPNSPPVIPSPLFFRILSQGVPYQVGLSLSGVATPAGGITAVNGIKSIVWNFGDGTQETITDALQALINHNYVATGNYTATLTVTDKVGLVSSENLAVNVIDTPIPQPKFTISPDTGNTLNVPITFDATPSVSQNAITGYRWLFCDSSTEFFTTSTTIQHTFTTAVANCSVRLRARTTQLAEGILTTRVTIGNATNPAGIPPVVRVFPPREVVLGSAHAFDGSASFDTHPGGSITAYNWNFNDSTDCPTAPVGCTGTGISPTHSYTFAANYSPNLSITDNLGRTSPLGFLEVFSVNATGHAPHAIAQASATSGVTPFTVSFDGTASYAYPPANLQNYLWRWFDGSPADGTSTATHTYTCTTPPSCTFTASLGVTDSDGNRHFASKFITVYTSREEMKRVSAGSVDPDREYTRQVIGNACVNGSAEACSQLGDMYAEDGDTATAANLHAKACSMGYQPACGTRNQE
jgi:hypothetical protein